MLQSSTQSLIIIIDSRNYKKNDIANDINVVFLAYAYISLFDFGKKTQFKNAGCLNCLNLQC